MSDQITMTVDEYNLMNVTKPSRSKYGNVKVVIDGHTFDSKAEARRYEELKLLQEQGIISRLQLQPRYLLIHAFRDTDGKFHRKTEYVGDYQYVDRDLARLICEDVKGGGATQTAVFKLKWKLAIQMYPGTTFRIVK